MDTCDNKTKAKGGGLNSEVAFQYGLGGKNEMKVNIYYNQSGPSLNTYIGPNFTQIKEELCQIIKT